MRRSSSVAFTFALAVAGALSLGGCAARAGGASSGALADQNGADGGRRMICEVERPTGSNIPERVCRPETRAEEERRKTQDWLASPRNSPPRR